MTPSLLPWLPVALPFLAAVALALVPRARPAALGNVAAAALTLLAALALLGAPRGVVGVLRLDGLNLWLLLLGAVVGLTTALYSAATLQEEGFDRRETRLYHVAFQLFLGGHHLALLADHLAVTWVAIETATLATAPVIAIHRTPAAIEAAWKFLVLCGVGIALALFGTVVLALAAEGAVPVAADRLSWGALMAAAPVADPGLLSLAFVFLLVGYGTKAGLVPMHAWLPDAHAEGPVALTAVLSGLLPNAALHALLRVSAVIDASPGAVPTGPFLAGLGLLSLLLAALALWRRRDSRRLFGWSSIEQMGLAAFAFGIGAPLAGVLHMAGHTLLKGAVFFALGRAIARKGSQKLADLTGLAASAPALGWGLALAVAGLAGLPPFALFASELGMALAAGRAVPWLLLPLGLGLLTAATALAAALQSLCLGPPTPDRAPMGTPALGGWAVLVPVWGHLALAALLGLAAPPLLAEAAAVLAR